MHNRPLQPTQQRLLALLLAVVAAAGVAAPVSAGGPVGRPGAGAIARRAAEVVAHGPRTDHVVALTFDDGYDAPLCGALVDELVATQTPATFFPNSGYVVHAPALWRRVAALGFPIGNHTATHPEMPHLSYAAQWTEIHSDRTVLERVIGESSLSVFRPPYGAYNKNTLIAARANGYSIVLNWDASFADSSRRANGRPWPLASYVRAATKGKDGSVILGHCGSRIDLAALPAVIAWYRARGFRFVTIPELLGRPGTAAMVFASAPRPVPGSARPRPV